MGIFTGKIDVEGEHEDRKRVRERRTSRKGR